MRQVYCSFEQLYRRLRLPRSYLRALARRGAIPYLLVGGRMKFDEDAVHEVLRQEMDSDRLQELMGHGRQGGQIACLPLPTVGDIHADGLIRRVMLKAPDAETLRRLTWALEGWELKADDKPVALLSLIEDWDGGVNQFTRASEWWETATPVVLPGFTAAMPRTRDSYVTSIKRWARRETSPTEYIRLVSPCQPSTINVTSMLMMSPMRSGLSLGMPWQTT